MDLLQSINETTSADQAQDDLYESNCAVIASAIDTDVVSLNESAIDWLKNLKSEVENGVLFKAKADNTAAEADQITKLRDTANIMGAIYALSDETQAEAMNIKDPKAILKIASSNHAQADKAMEFLKGKGRTDAKGQSQKALELLKAGNPDAVSRAITGMINKAQKLLLIKNDKQADPAPTPAAGKLGLSDEMKKDPFNS